MNKLRKNQCPWLNDDGDKYCGLPIGDNDYRLCTKHAEMKKKQDEEDKEED